MTMQRTITLSADQWDAILDAVLDAVASHRDEGAFGEGWTRSRLGAASAALSSALEQPKLELERPTDEELEALANDCMVTGVLVRRSHPSIEWNKPTDEEIREWFNRWWRNEGSAMRPLPGHDHEEHARRISEIAWANGAYVARWGSQPSTVAHSTPRWYDSTAPTGKP